MAGVEGGDRTKDRWHLGRARAVNFCSTLASWASQVRWLAWRVSINCRRSWPFSRHLLLIDPTALKIIEGLRHFLNGSLELRSLGLLLLEPSQGTVQVFQAGLQTGCVPARVLPVAVAVVAAGARPGAGESRDGAIGALPPKIAAVRWRFPLSAAKWVSSPVVDYRGPVAGLVVVASGFVEGLASRLYPGVSCSARVCNCWWRP